MSLSSSSTGFRSDDLLSLNKSCLCLPIDRWDIDQKILDSNPIPGLSSYLSNRPHMFAGTSVFLSHEDLSDMYEQIDALEAAAKSNVFRKARLSSMPDDLKTAQSATCGVLMGYDFHITATGPKLIEINTNAGGAFLVAALQESVGQSSLDVQKNLTATFIAEWQRVRSSDLPSTIAVVDAVPQDQYLYPDMLLARQWFEIAGIDTVIVEPSDLRLEDGRLKHGPRTIDMVYNRLTDFMLEHQDSHVLREALSTDAAVVSPAPRHHALHANKQNLALLSNTEERTELGFSSVHEAVLSRLLKTEIVSRKNADELWKNRRRLFFKPASGFAGRAAYRGSKLTRRVWDEILTGDYVAQEFVQPTYRAVEVDGAQSQLKYDVRVYTYGGTPLLLAARVYQGQTTNFRSPGGGFAPIITTSASNC